MLRDLTVGKPSRVLLQYSLPLFGSIIFQQMYNVADTFVAGHFISTGALAAVGNAFEITLLYTGFAFGCNLGISVITAMYFGKKDFRTMKSSVYTALITAGVLALLLTVLGFVFAPDLLQMINTHEDIFTDCLQYLRIYIGGFLFTLAYNLATGIFSSLGDSRTPFIFLAISSTANVLLDILFVTVFQMGVAGTAWATLLCQGLSGIVSMAAVLWRLKKIPTEGKVDLFRWDLLKELTRVAIPSLLQQSFISVGNIAIQGLINIFGPSATGGFASAGKLNMMVISCLHAFGNGISNYTAQNAGAEKPRRIRQGLKSAIFMAAAVALLFTATYQLFARDLVSLFITDGNTEAIDMGAQFLRIASPFYLFLGLQLMINGVLRGVQKMGLFMISTGMDLLLRVIAAYLFAGPWGLTGIWCAWPVGFLISAAIAIGLYLVVQRSNFGVSDRGDGLEDLGI